MATPAPVEDQHPECRLHQVIAMLEDTAKYSYPVLHDEKKHYARKIMETCAQAIRDHLAANSAAAQP